MRLEAGEAYPGASGYVAPRNGYGCIDVGVSFGQLKVNLRHRSYLELRGGCHAQAAFADFAQQDLLVCKQLDRDRPRQTFPCGTTLFMVGWLNAAEFGC